MDYLLFRLYGPMASWGEIAVGEIRRTASYPGKSAIIGLIAAALGIKRSDIDKQQQVQRGYTFAMEVCSQGTLLRDYHTVQVPDSVGNFTYRTRRDELVFGKARLGTILSSREYRSDALAVVAVKALPDAPYDLQTIREYLNKPRFHLYLGRKSCPLALPLDPQIIVAKDYYSALRAYQHKPILLTYEECEGQIAKRDHDWLVLFKDRHYYWEGEAIDFSDSPDLSRMQTRTRHDQPVSRKRWQFAPRQEHYFYRSGGE